MAAKAVESDPVEEAMRDGEEAYAVAFAFANLRLIINEHLRVEDWEAINGFDFALGTLRNMSFTKAVRHDDTGTGYVLGSALTHCGQQGRARGRAGSLPQGGAVWWNSSKGKMADLALWTFAKNGGAA